MIYNVSLKHKIRNKFNFKSNNNGNKYQKVKQKNGKGKITYMYYQCKYCTIDNGYVMCGITMQPLKNKGCKKCKYKYNN